MAGFHGDVLYEPSCGNTIIPRSVWVSEPALSHKGHWFGNCHRSCASSKDIELTDQYFTEERDSAEGDTEWHPRKTKGGRVEDAQRADSFGITNSQTATNGTSPVVYNQVKRIKL